MPQEVELKLELEENALAVVGESPVLAGTAPEIRHHRSTYYDTADGVLSSHGYALRVRQTGDHFVQTVKGPGGGAGLFQRPEWEWQVTDFAPDLARIRDTPAAALLDGAALGPHIETEFSRCTWTLEPEGARVAVTLDEGQVRSAAQSAPLREMEIELLDGMPEALFALAQAIAATVPLRLSVLSKSERGTWLAKDRLGKAVKAEPIVLRGDMPVAEAAAAVFHSCLRQYRLNEAVLLERRDAVALHQARVAMRRLRSSFSLFGKALKDDQFSRLREEIRWFTGQLGPARNLDVFMRRLPEGAGAPVSQEVHRIVSAAREAAYDQALGAIRSQRLRRLMLDFVEWTALGAWRQHPVAARTLAKFARKRLEKRWRAIARSGRKLGALEPEPLHRLRIDIKKMRYAVEFIAALYDSKQIGRQRKAFLNALETVQEQLGEINDAHTARGLVAAFPFATSEQRTFANHLIPRGPDQRALIRKAGRAYGALEDASGFWREGVR